MRANQWISDIFLKPQEKRIAETTCKQRELEPLPSSVYDTPRSCNSDMAGETASRSEIQRALFSGESSTTCPKLHIQKSEIKNLSNHINAKREQGELFSVSVSPNSLINICNKNEHEIAPLTRQQGDFMEQLAKTRKNLKQSLKIWKQERKDKKLAITERDNTATNNKIQIPSHRKQQLLLLLNKVKEKQQRNNMKNNGAVTNDNAVRQTLSTGHHDLAGNDFKNVVEQVYQYNNEEDEDEEFIASVIKVGIGDSGAGDRKKKTKTTSLLNFERNTFITNTERKQKKTAKVPCSNSQLDLDATTGNGVTPLVLGGGQRVGHLYAEQQQKIHQLKAQLLEKEKQIDLLQHQLSEAKQEIENSIDFYALSVIKLEGNIIAMSEEHEIEVAKLKEDICVYKKKQAENDRNGSDDPLNNTQHHLLRSSSSAKKTAAHHHYVSNSANKLTDPSRCKQR